MWEGEIELGEEMGIFRKGERVEVRMRTQQFNIRNTETLDWTPDIKLATLHKYPRGFLKRKHALRYFIQDSHILRVEPTLYSHCPSLLNILDKKHWGLLEPVSQNSVSYTPLLVFLSKNPGGAPMLAAFCVECEMFESKLSAYSSFRKLLRENIKYDIVKSVVSEMEERGELAPLDPSADNAFNLHSQSIKLLRGKVEDRMPKKEAEEAASEDMMSLLSNNQAAWETNYRGMRTLNYQLTISVEDKSDREFFVFSPASSSMRDLESDTQISVMHKNDQDSCAAELVISSLNLSEPARFIRTLSDLEQYFLHMGSVEEEDGDLHLIVKSENLTNLLEQFETKQKCKVTVISKLDQDSPYVYCSLEPESEWNTTLPICKKEEVEYYEPGVDDIKGIKVKETLNYLKKEDKRSRKNHNPDEIIDGKPKWSEMKFVRKRRRSNGEDIEHEDSFDFDRLNPHRTFVQEFEDQLDNTDWVYNNTVLKMMSDLNSETLVTLGDARLPPEAEARLLREHAEWERYKRENKHTFPQVKLKRLKSDKLVKTYNINKIVTKNLRKNPHHCSTPLYS